jgi:hypothetical protein
LSLCGNARSRIAKGWASVLTDSSAPRTAQLSRSRCAFLTKNPTHSRPRSKTIFTHFPPAIPALIKIRCAKMITKAHHRASLTEEDDARPTPQHPPHPAPAPRARHRCLVADSPISRLDLSPRAPQRTIVAHRGKTNPPQPASSCRPRRHGGTPFRPAREFSKTKPRVILSHPPKPGTCHNLPKPATPSPILQNEATARGLAWHPRRRGGPASPATPRKFAKRTHPATAPLFLSCQHF